MKCGVAVKAKNKKNYRKICCKKQAFYLWLFSELPCLTLSKMPQFHLISWCGNFVERHSFRIVSGDSSI